jgi:D-serine dehydratase
VGKRDISFDLSMPVPIARAARGSLQAEPVPAGWVITALNDQHAYLRWDAAEEPVAPVVGDRVGLGISHHWMPVVEADYRVSDAVAMHF